MDTLSPKHFQLKVPSTAATASLHQTISQSTAASVYPPQTQLPSESEKSWKPIQIVKDATFARMKCLTHIEHVIDLIQKCYWKPYLLNILNIFSFILFFLYPFLRSCKGVVCLTVELFVTGKAAASKAAEHPSRTSCHHFPEAWNSVRGRGSDKYRTRRQPSLQITKPSTQKRPDFHFHVRKSV